jgi:hypothetical protein
MSCPATLPDHTSDRIAEKKRQVHPSDHWNVNKINGLNWEQKQYCGYQAHIQASGLTPITCNLLNTSVRKPFSFPDTDHIDVTKFN